VKKDGQVPTVFQCFSIVLIKSGQEKNTMDRGVIGKDVAFSHPLIDLFCLVLGVKFGKRLMVSSNLGSFSYISCLNDSATKNKVF
jgi:hypothetical protein